MDQNMEASPPQSMLSRVQSLQNRDSLRGPSSSIHAFGNFTETQKACSVLQELIQTGNQLSAALNLFTLTPFVDPKLCSLLRQHCSVTQSLNLSEHSKELTVKSLRSVGRPLYGEDVPLNSTKLASWCVTRFESWAAEVGMETYKDEKDGGVTLVFGGKILAMDVELSTAPDVFEVAHVKISYAIPESGNGGASTKEGSPALESFLLQKFREFSKDVQKQEHLRDPLRIARLAKELVGHMKYMMMLDGLAARSEGGGLRWFMDLDDLSTKLFAFAKAEAEVAASSLSNPNTPTDIFLLRSHGLPLQCLTSPSLSFLVHLTKAAYLQLIRDVQSSLPSSKDEPQLDLPVSDLRRLVPKTLGCTTATLSLVSVSGSKSSLSVPGTRPSFRLVPSGSELDHDFPLIADPNMFSDGMDITSTLNSWILDFTDGGKRPGVILSQARMRDIEIALNPLSGMDNLSPVTLSPLRAASWVDMVVNPNSAPSLNGYCGIYNSPSSSHPPLQLYLAVPDEPGFILERVPVWSLKQVWTVIEIVREQCWLNDILNECEWANQNVKQENLSDEDIQDPTEDELHAMISGTLTPRKIPVNVSIPPASAPTFEALDLDAMTIPPPASHRPRIVMKSPEKAPISGVVEVIVTYDEAKPRGVSVEVNGTVAMSSELKIDILEEVSRRGATLSLPGRIYGKNI